MSNINLNLPGKVTIVDFETTSLVEPRATEIGLVALDENLEECAHYETIIRPPKKVTKQALGISRLTLQQVNNAGTFEDYWPDIFPFINKRVLVAHNSEFDVSVLRAELLDLGETYKFPMICTYKISRSLNPDLKIHRLPVLSEMFSINLDSHKALSDARATGKLLKKFSDMSEEIIATIDRHYDNLEGLAAPQWESKPPNSRNKTVREQRDSDTLHNTFDEILRTGKRDAALTGTPKIGKEEFSVRCLKIGFRYNRAKPGVRHTAFLVVSEKDSGLSKIAEAERMELPILTEQEFEEFCQYKS